MTYSKAAGIATSRRLCLSPNTVQLGQPFWGSRTGFGNRKCPGPTGKAYPPPGGSGTVHWLRLATCEQNARRSGVRMRDLGSTWEVWRCFPAGLGSGRPLILQGFFVDLLSARQRVWLACGSALACASAAALKANSGGLTLRGSGAYPRTRAGADGWTLRILSVSGGV